ncbi:type II secretion system GspH family protein [bacterium]|nr:type II secretion system GspH family protein [bacterium]
MRQTRYMAHRWAVTMIELMIVVLIIGLLATVATGIYTNEADRARVAATRALINNLEIAITRYSTDTGQLPPSGSGEYLPPSEPLMDPGTRRDGSGYLHQAVVHSLSGNSTKPYPQGWVGPYINLQNEQLSPSKVNNTTVQPGEIDIVDSWGTPIIYVKWTDYGTVGTDFTGGTMLFPGTAPTGANPSLPAPNPSVAFGETYYNAKSYQIISFGKDRKSLGISGSYHYNGADEDDVTNFGY